MIGHSVVAKFHVRAAQCPVLGGPASRALTPHFERTGQQLSAHQADHLGLAQARTLPDGLERGPVFPGHLDHGRYIARAQSRKAVRGFGVHGGARRKVSGQSPSVTEPENPSGYD